MATPDPKPAKPSNKRPRVTIGWREWLRIPEFGIQSIKAKVDTGARTSSLHAFRVKAFDQDGVTHVRFSVHPVQRKATPTIECVCPVHEFRRVRSSSGHATLRPVITVEVEVAGVLLPIELTLANRDAMGFRMLLGRQALRERFLVDAGQSYVGGRPSRPRRARAARKRSPE